MGQISKNTTNSISLLFHAISLFFKELPVDFLNNQSSTLEKEKKNVGKKKS